MTVRALIKDGATRLAAAGVPDPRLDAEYLLAEALHAPRLNLLLSMETAVPPAAAEQFENSLHRREKREPLQYILGSQPFFGLTLTVTPDVLIPRGDTEALCEWALDTLPRAAPAQVLDLCTGSGALAIAIRHERPQAQVTAADISPAALAVARQNACALHVAVRFVQGDLFAPVAGQVFDLIVSNPPYIPTGDLSGLQLEVQFEPSLALDGGADGLDFYRRILRDAPRYLSTEGRLGLEIGDGEADAVAAMMASDFEDIRTLCDLGGRTRVVAGRKKHGY